MKALLLMLLMLIGLMGTAQTYKGHDYDYYKKKSKQATGLLIFSAVLTTTGFVAFGIGLSKTVSATSSDNYDAIGFFAYSFFAINIFTPITIASAVKFQNNRKAMKMCVGITPDGAGLVIKF